MTELTQLPSFVAKTAKPALAWLSTVVGGVVQLLWPTEALQKMAVAVFVLFLADTLSGFLAAVVRKEVNSQGARRVFVKFCGYVIYIVVAAAVPYIVPVEFFREYELVPITAVMGGIAYTELVSILENLKKMEVVIDGRFLRWVQPILERIKGPEPEQPKAEDR